MKKIKDDLNNCIRNVYYEKLGQKNKEKTKGDTMDRFKFRVWDNEEKEFINSWETNCCNFDYEAYRLGYWETVEQCTGLKDKKGKLIFEGDIMQYPESEEVFIVKIDRLTGKYLAWFGEDDQLALFLEINDRGQAVVIGNIHENLELFEG